MHHSQTDRVAREAARLYELGKASTVPEAIRRAMEDLHAASHERPSTGRVREHIRGFAMQSMGAAGYATHVREVLEMVEELMTCLERYDPLLVGRVARGQIDGGATINLRIYTDAGLDELAELLVEHGYQEPTFHTINTSFGRLNQLAIEEAGWPIRITRCRVEMRPHAARNLVREGEVAVLTLDGLRQRLAEPA